MYLGNEPSKLVFIDQDVFIKQLKKLNSTDQLITRLAIEYVLATDAMSLAKTTWLKSLGSGLWEFRIGPSINSVLKNALAEPIVHNGGLKILVRIFVAFGNEQIILIGCYDKLRNGGGKRQNKAISDARSLLLKYRGKN